ncbi:phosphomannomutase/phosphoglucomutase [Corallococcus sp. AB030]|uniref:phosphomannomutase/phosphoglucomutase n=1 Tax=Corallococcus TaxID=83461 RepID=UPI000EEF8840|nr:MULTISPECIES: phosphomannomutase/phosphoglucomutase [Corallococcus]NNB97116.1 phosphomannomutase/phosphoglucomutase [Corallococcus exiguus]NPC48854.1 phosphomannomutase/phosphoglucomutase [Corallococcus exiguus]NRD55333.1 phosphomannomutase/phosphoglucomutase [Corallococcus exiguus]RKH79835.1 phosphomannomutase/phosphoglucomutase [Corallococcus sp. AB032C]RKI06400.1 phosphomannomutase/phosphoglucomutase [Corallococcus sp. AB030]
MNAHIFREYDIRGLVDKDLTIEVVELLGLGLGTMIRRKGGTSIAVGRDCRESSTRFRDALAKGLTATGLDVYDVGVVPTPLTYFAANTLPVDGLAMITGSHNPKEFNGFKIGAGKTTFHGPEIKELRRLIEAKDFATSNKPGKVTPFDIITPYNHFIRQTVKVGRKGMKIVIDAGNGTGGAIAVPLFESMGFDVVPLFCEMDADFPNHHPDPTVVENLQDLIKKVKEVKAEVGIAYDGDSDRIGVIDDQGNVLWGDQLMVLFSRYVLKESPGAAIIGEVKCSYTMYDDIAKHGGRPIMWKAGHSLIKSKMKEEHAELAGEMSGHIFFKHRYFGFDDAVYASARLLEILTHEKQSMSQLLSDVPKTFASPELRFDTTEEKKFAMVKRATEILRDAGHKVVDVDGVRVTFEDGWGLIRASNTQPILVLRYEASTEARVKEIQALIEKTVAQAQKEVGA